MATKAKLSKEEMWLEKTFGADVSSFDPKVQEGGKMHDDFLDDLKEFKKAWESFEDVCIEAMKAEPPKDDGKANLLHDLVVKNHKQSRNYAQKGNPEGALVEIKASAKNAIELLKLLKGAKAK